MFDKDTDDHFDEAAGMPRSQNAGANNQPAGLAAQEVDAEVFGIERLAGVRSSFATRRVSLPQRFRLLRAELRPTAGDLLLARVESIGQHTRIELPEGRRSQLYQGDEILVAYGNRYAPDQFEAEVPDDLGDCQLVAAGGIAAKVVSRNARLKRATRIRPIGLFADLNGKTLNLSDWRLDSRPIPKPLPPVVVVAGTAMNAGKTTAAARLIKGLVRAGKRVGAAKVTGTGAGGDYWQMKDAGASEVVDFTDAGFASTYLLPPQEVEKAFLRLLSHLGNLNLDVIVVEVADGILQIETSQLLASQGFSYYCNKLIFAASDAMGAVAGVQWLQAHELEVSAVSGSLTASPLAVRETSGALGLPVLSKNDLSDPATALALLDGTAR